MEKMKDIAAQVKTLEDEAKTLRDIDKLLDTKEILPGLGTYIRVHRLVDEVETLRKDDVFRISHRDYWRMIPYRDLRPEVLAFAKKMEAKLRQRDDRPHWRSEGDPQLMSGLQREVAELVEAIFLKGRKEIAEEAVDVANYAMFIADKHGGLK